MKPKDWLLANGHIKEITRGRMSRENIALIQEAVNNGAKIEGYAPSEEGEEVNRVATDPNRILDIPEFPFRDEKAYEPFANGERWPLGMRGCCELCKNSLTYCGCETPYVRIDNDRLVMVEFRARTRPIKKWW